MFRKSSLRTAASVIAGALFGLVMGALIGGWLVEREAQRGAGELAATYVARVEAIAAEGQSALAEINGSPDPICSDADIAHLRRVVLASRFLKSASRQQGNRTSCSSDIGRFDAQEDLPPADFVTDKGLGLTLNAPMPMIAGGTAMLMAKGGATVAISTRAFIAQLDPRLAFAVIARRGEASTVLFSAGVEVPRRKLDLVPGGSMEIAGLRHEVRCSADQAVCVLAMLQNPTPTYQSPVLLGFALCGLLAGMGCGFGIGAVVGRSRPIGKSLRAALRAGTLTVVYQPIVQLADRQRTGAEALLRWSETVGKPVSPDVFIAVAEEEGFITDLTHFVVRRVLAELGEQLRQRPGFRVTINVSAHDLLDVTFATFLRNEFRTANVPADSIGFELTERSTAERSAIARGIQRLRELGHKVYIDDFGTDYSSLSYLAHLHVDAIKIDRLFTLALHETGHGASIAPQIVAMAEALGLILVIEGIEEESQAAYFLKLDQKALAQGWLFGKPVPADRLFVVDDDGVGPVP
jgi:sensor c-di-GMP phosphodiesterase-like protein